MDVLESLCWYDPRNPSYFDYEYWDPEDIPKPRQEDCACDSCFHGKDALALEVLKLREELASTTS